MYVPLLLCLASDPHSGPVGGGNSSIKLAANLQQKLKEEEPGSNDKMADLESSSSVTGPSDSETGPPKLSELLDRGWKIFEEVDSTEEPLSSTSVQVRVRRGVSLLEEAAGMVAQLDLFSRNEELEEVSTADLKYLLLPALRGALSLKLSGRDRRLDAVRTARAHFMDFLRRCKDYNMFRFDLPPSAAGNGSGAAESGASEAPSAPRPPDLVAMAAQRQAKIEQYRQKKELEARLSEVRRALESGQADDEASRDFYLLSIRRWISVSLEEVQSIDQELQLIQHMEGGGHRSDRGSHQTTRTPMKPFILTKEAVQARVFGAGYPSLPTMTVDDWYEQHSRRGVLPDQGVPGTVPGDEDAKDREDEDKEKKAENDDEESLLKVRNWDDWKDTHRRGYGNRQNMG
ncbi:immunoglobulin-binding protein 1 [Brachyistius frenatus]|uniref:immunoglobulin-binding protein 1 n=1 Tax=Brachyistius frenatus TaxID=100188 RepID=UPI0037E73E7B